MEICERQGLGVLGHEDLRSGQISVIVIEGPQERGIGKWFSVVKDFPSMAGTQIHFSIHIQGAGSQGVSGSFFLRENLEQRE